MKERFVSTQNWNQKFVASQKYEGMSCPPPPLSLPSLSSPSSLFSSWFLRTLSGMAALKIHLDITSTKCRRESIARNKSSVVQGRIQEIGIEKETPVNHHMFDSKKSSASIPMVQILLPIQRKKSSSMQEKILSYISSLEDSPAPSTTHTIREHSSTCIMLSSEFESCRSLKNLDPVCAAGDDSDLISNQLHVDVDNVIMPLPSSLHMNNRSLGSVFDCHLDLDVVPVESFFSDESALPSYRAYTKTNDIDEFNSDSYQYTGSWKNIGSVKTIVPFSGGGDGGGMDPKYLSYLF